MQESKLTGITEEKSRISQLGEETTGSSDAAAAKNAVEELRVNEARDARIAAAAKAMEEAATAAAEAMAAEKARRRVASEMEGTEGGRASDTESKSFAEAGARAEEEAAAKARAEAQAKAVEEAELRAAAEAKAAEEAELRAAAEAGARAEEEAAAKARADAQAKAAEEAELRAAAEAKSKAEEEAQIAAATAALDGAVKKKSRRDIASSDADEKSAPSTESAENAWFYTHEGERLGPVGFEDLRAMAADSKLDPRLDMVWRQSMDAWQAAGQIDGLFERKSGPVESGPTLAPAAVPVHPRQTSRAGGSKDVPWPGARRRSFILVTLFFPIAWYYALEAGSPILVSQFGELMMEAILPVVAFVPLGVLAYFTWKRLVNLGMSPLWGLGFFAPFLNLWVAYRCFACPAGYAYSKKLDAPGVVLAVVYGLSVLAVVLILAAFVALMFGVIEDPELQEQFRALMRMTET